MDHEPYRRQACLRSAWSKEKQTPHLHQREANKIPFIFVSKSAIPFRMALAADGACKESLKLSGATRIRMDQTTRLRDAPF